MRQFLEVDVGFLLSWHLVQIKHPKHGVVLFFTDIGLALPLVVGRKYAHEFNGMIISPDLLVVDLSPPLYETVYVDFSFGFLVCLGISHLPPFLDSFISSLQDFRPGSRMGGPCFRPPPMLCQ